MDAVLRADMREKVESASAAPGPGAVQRIVCQFRKASNQSRFQSGREDGGVGRILAGPPAVDQSRLIRRAAPGIHVEIAIDVGAMLWQQIVDQGLWQRRCRHDKGVERDHAALGVGMRRPAVAVGRDQHVPSQQVATVGAKRYLARTLPIDREHRGAGVDGSPGRARGRQQPQMIKSGMQGAEFGHQCPANEAL